MSLKLEKRMVRVEVNREEYKRLDKWACTCNAEKVKEVHSFPSGKTRITLRFRDQSTKDIFLRELNTNFGKTVKVF